MRRLVIVAAVTLLASLAALKVYDRPPKSAGSWLAEAGVKDMFAVVDGVRVRYVRRGQGPAVVLLHGFASSIYTWKDVLPGLAAGHEVIALDLPGFGASDQPSDLSFETCHRVAIGLMDQLGIPRASVVGHSLGGAVALVIAARQPERVDRLVLIDAAGFNLRLEDRPTLVRVSSHPAAEAFFTRLPVRRLFVTIGLRQNFFDDRKVTPERVDEYLVAAARPGTLAAIRSLAASSTLAPEDVEQMLGEVRAPTLVVWGDHDEWIPLAHADRFAAGIAASRKVVVRECGHMPQEEKPAETLELLLEFLGG